MFDVAEFRGSAKPAWRWLDLVDMDGRSLSYTSFLDCFTLPSLVLVHGLGCCEELKGSTRRN